MGLIKGKNGIQKMIIGYPTVSDKYDVAPATLEGSSFVYNGDVVMFGSAAGLYKKAASLTAASQIAGIVLATNVKVPSTYPAPAGSVATQTGDAFNLIVKGFIAVELDGGADLSACKEGATVYCTSTGKLTNVDTSNIATSWKFTGIVETQSTKKVAEIVL